MVKPEKQKTPEGEPAGAFWTGRQQAFRQRDRKALMAQIGGGGRLDGVAELHGGSIVREASLIRKPKGSTPWLTHHLARHELRHGAPRSPIGFAYDIPGYENKAPCARQ
jgi:hypothetical protein